MECADSTTHRCTADGSSPKPVRRAAEPVELQHLPGRDDPFASDFCSYFNCIPSFWQSTNGYGEECHDGTYSHSGGRSGPARRADFMPRQVSDDRYIHCSRRCRR
jgi:hypothetical protein